MQADKHPQQFSLPASTEIRYKSYHLRLDSDLILHGYLLCAALMWKDQYTEIRYKSYHLTCWYYLITVSYSLRLCKFYVFVQHLLLSTDDRALAKVKKKVCNGCVLKPVWKDKVSTLTTVRT